jgi:PAS domain S-box-containing protein
LSDRVPEAQRLQALLACAEQVAQMGSWEYVPSAGELVWSDNHFRIFGLEPGEVAPTVQYVLEQTHPDDRDRVSTAERALAERGELRTLEFRIMRGDHKRRHVRATLAAVEKRDERPYRMVGTLQDVTDSRRAEREIAAHAAVAEALVRWKALEPGAQHLLAELADAMDCVAAVFWVPQGDVLLARVLWHDACCDVPLFERATRQARLRRGIGLPGRAWPAGEPLQWSCADTTTSDPREPAAGGDGLRGAVAIPALAGEEVLAVVELKSDEEVELTPRLMRSLCGIGSELGQFLDHRRGELAEPLLTPREIEVLQLGAGGLSTRQAAERLMLSPATVKTHLENIYAKLEVGDKSSAVATALRLGLIE